MKLHVLFEMDLDEYTLRNAFHTNNEEETALVFKSLMMSGIDEAMEQDKAENVKVNVTLKE